ncbi:MAG: hypothetical protein RLZ55_1253 [Actinomycetota bacterium]
MDRRVALPVALSALLAGCAFSVGGPATGSFRTPESRNAPELALQQFYDQTLAWQECGSGNECARLQVPMDYASPGAGTVELAVVRVPSSGQGRDGTLVVNPGGPGGSGVEYAEAADLVLTSDLRQAYDVVGFDPRGVGASDPLQCTTGPQLDQFIAADGSPDTPDELAAVDAESKELGARCLAADATLAANIGSANVVKDMDILRAALDQPKLNYLGFSYGTYLGALYADEFGTRVGRFVLDGAIDPTLTNTDLSHGQAVAFEVALQRYLDDCAATSSCPLGTDPAAAKQKLLDLLAKIDAQPLPTSDPKRPLTQSLALSGVIYPLYQPSLGWPLLTDALAAALRGDGAPLLDIVDRFDERSADGTYANNGLDALYAVNCVDRPDRPDLQQTEQLAGTWAQEAPAFGAYLAYGNLPCGYWPLPATGTPKAIAAAEAPPILVVGTQYDPATPYAWAEALAEQLASGVLLTWQDADGHTAYNNGSACIDATIDGFLIDGIVPPDGKVCS